MNRTEKRREKRTQIINLLSALIPLITALINLIPELADWLTD